MYHYGTTFEREFETLEEPRGLPPLPLRARSRDWKRRRKERKRRERSGGTRQRRRRRRRRKPDLYPKGVRETAAVIRNKKGGLPPRGQSGHRREFQINFCRMRPQCEAYFSRNGGNWSLVTTLEDRLMTLFPLSLTHVVSSCARA